MFIELHLQQSVDFVDNGILEGCECQQSITVNGIMG